MKRKFLKLSIICAIAILILLILLIMGLKVYTKHNYDIKVITNNGRSFFLIDTSKKEYYLINSHLETKCQINNFDILSDEPDNNYIQTLRELEKQDKMFSYSENNNSVFIYNDDIYYQRTQNYVDNQIANEPLSTIYKFDANTKQISLFINGNDNAPQIEIKTAVLQKIYPDFESAISKVSNNGFNCEESYYDNGRIVFEICRSTSTKGTTSYLYEYFPKSNKTKRIAKFKSDVIDVYFQE